MGFKDYFIPKSMIYTGKYKEIHTLYRIYDISKKEVLAVDHYDLASPNKQYIQVIGLTDTDKIESLAKDFNIDPLIVADILNVRQRDKIELFGDALFCAVKVRYLKEETICESYMSMLMLDKVLLSFHEVEPEFLIQLPDLLQNHHEIKKNPIDYLFYQILDIVTDHMIDVNELLEKQMGIIEEEILESRQSDQESFYQIRKELLKLKNSVSPIYEQLVEMVKSFPLIDKSNRPYYDDLIDHLRRLDVQLLQSREMMRHLLDLNMNNQSNRMNKIMTTLTLFSAIFIPLSFLTGFFGMNFVHFGILEYHQAVGLFVIFCVMVAIIMFYIFKKSKWL